MKTKVDKRNKLNDLDGKNWIKSTKSYWISEKCVDDKIALKHPAPFMVKDIIKLVSFFTKKNIKLLKKTVTFNLALLGLCIFFHLPKQFREKTILVQKKVMH